MRLHAPTGFGLAALTTCAVLALTSSAALADVGPSPPSDCPPGAAGTTSRSQSWCLATECASDADCPSKTDTQYRISARPQDVTYRCATAGLCVESKSLDEHNKVPADGGGWSVQKTQVSRDVATKACSDDSACSSGVKCNVRKRCLEATRTYKDDGSAVPFFKSQTVGLTLAAADGGSVPAAPDATKPSTGKCGCIVGMESSAQAPWVPLLLLAPACKRLVRRKPRKAADPAIVPPR